MKYIILVTISLLTFLPSTVFSDTQLNFEYDYCVFKNDDTSSFVEFYYSFLQNELAFVKTSEGYQLEGLINLQIVSNETGKEMFNQSFKTPMIVADTSGYNKNSSLMGQINFILKKGTYRLVINASDFNDSQKVFNAQDNIIIENFPAGISSSSLQLSTMITKSSDESDVFFKNSLEVIPNPSRIFGKNLSDVYYYVEFYNLSTATVSEGYSVIKNIKDLNNNPVKSGRTDYKFTGASRIEYGHFNISGIATGNYYFEVLLQDSKNKTLVEQKNKFWVYNTIDTNSTALTADDKYLLSEYKSYTQKQIDDEIEQVSYILSDQFRNQLDNTKDLEGKRILLFSFWDKYDPNKTTTVNEFKVSYFEKIKYANKNFGSAFMLGWKTDRGRIFSIYGKPDEIERFPFGANEKAHEIWKYNLIEGGVEFVFVDLTNNGDNYQLVHSTKKDELSDEKWRDRLKIN